MSISHTCNWQYYGSIAGQMYKYHILLLANSSTWANIHCFSLEFHKCHIWQHYYWISVLAHFGTLIVCGYIYNLCQYKILFTVKWFGKSLLYIQIAVVTKITRPQELPYHTSPAHQNANKNKNLNWKPILQHIFPR